VRLREADCDRLNDGDLLVDGPEWLGERVWEGLAEPESVVVGLEDGDNVTLGPDSVLVGLADIDDVRLGPDADFDQVFEGEGVVEGADGLAEVLEEGLVDPDCVSVGLEEHEDVGLGPVADFEKLGEPERVREAERLGEAV